MRVTGGLTSEGQETQGDMKTTTEASERTF